MTRTITNPAASSSLSSAVIRNELQLLEDEIASGSNPGHTHTVSTGATDVTSSAAELNILDGAVLSTTELNYVDGVTSAIQTQLDAKAPLAGPTFTGTVVLPSTTSIGTVSNTEIGYLDGVTSSIQTQLNAKGAGDVVGPSSSTDNALVRFDSTTGKLVQNSAITFSDSGLILDFPTDGADVQLTRSGTDGYGFRIVASNGTTSDSDGGWVRIVSGNGHTTDGAGGLIELLGGGGVGLGGFQGYSMPSAFEAF